MGGTCNHISILLVAESHKGGDIYHLCEKGRLYKPYVSAGVLFVFMKRAKGPLSHANCLQKTMNNFLMVEQTGRRKIWSPIGYYSIKCEKIHTLHLDSLKGSVKTSLLANTAAFRLKPIP